MGDRTFFGGGGGGDPAFIGAQIRPSDEILQAQGVVQWDDVLIDPHGFFDPVTHGFALPSAEYDGYYEASAIVGVIDFTADDIIFTVSITRSGGTGGNGFVIAENYVGVEGDTHGTAFLFVQTPPFLWKFANGGIVKSNVGWDTNAPGMRTVGDSGTYFALKRLGSE